MVKETMRFIKMAFPEVEWDRWSGVPEDYSVFGWIKRKDGQRDFVLFHMVNEDIENFDTSSAKYSKIFSERLDFTHNDCHKVEVG